MLQRKRTGYFLNAKPRGLGCSEPTQGSDIEPSKQRVKGERWGEGLPNAETTHAKVLWPERVSPPQRSARWLSGSGAHSTSVRSVPGQSHHDEANSLQWIARGHQGKGREVSLMFQGMAVKLLPPQVSQRAAWAGDCDFFLFS